MLDEARPDVRPARPHVPMTHEIRVARLTSEEYRVELTEGEERRVYVVTATPADVERLGAGRSGEELVDESFRFLLERELIGRIPPSFHVLVIARYHPEYLDEFPDRMRRASEHGP